MAGADLGTTKTERSGGGQGGPRDKKWSGAEVAEADLGTVKGKGVNGEGRI